MKSPDKHPGGRPKGTFKLDEKKEKKLTLWLTPTAYNWIKAQPKFWLTEWLESQSRLGKDDGK